MNVEWSDMCLLEVYHKQIERVTFSENYERHGENVDMPSSLIYLSKNLHKPERHSAYVYDVICISLILEY
jgi:tRNA(Arg) A34 adenosine deaminase TadA